MKKNLMKLTAFVTAIILVVGMCTVFASAYNTDDFSDVQPTHWAYDNIMSMADKGVIKGIGGGAFAPEMGLKYGEFLALVGRAMYPNDCNEAGTSAWWETYYAAAVDKGLLRESEIAGTAVNMERLIVRNHMARILVRADEKINGNSPIAADTKAITDFELMPDEFKPYATQAYAKGLLTGDESGNFNGGQALRRSEASTVIVRLLDAANKPIEALKGATGADMTGEMITVKFGGYVECTDFYGDSTHTYPAGVNMIMTTADGRVLGTTTTYATTLDNWGMPEGFTYTMTVTMDKADYAYDQNIYYMSCTYIAADGQRFSNISSHTGVGRDFQLPSSRIYVIAQYDFTGSHIKFGIGNQPGCFLDF